MRRPAQPTPRPQNLHSDPDLQIRQPCGARGRGRAGGGAAGRTPERKFGKLRIRAWPEPHSQRPGLKLGSQAKQNFLSGHTSFGDQGAVRSAVERSDSMFGSWRKLPDGAQPTSPEQCLMAQASSYKFPECNFKVRGRRKTWTEISLLHAST